MPRVVPVDEHGRELIHPTSPEFQFINNLSDLHEYAGKTNPHWHDAMEFVYITEGAMYMKVDNDEMLLVQGDSLFINSNAIHGARLADKNCIFITLMVYPLVFGRENEGLRSKYIDTVLGSRRLSCHAFDGRSQDGKRVLHLLEDINRIDRGQREDRDGYELVITSRLLEVWHLLFQRVQNRLSTTGMLDKKIKVIKDMLGYIHDHYTEKVTLDQIAAAAGISKSSCSHIFKAYMREPVFSYLLRYRIDQSLLLLISKDYNVTESALAVGFSDSSYYTKVFKLYMGCSPTEYCKRVSEQNTHGPIKYI